MSTVRPPQAARVLGALAIVFAIGGCAHLVILHDPLSATEHNDLGVVYERKGENELAAREYRRALRLDPHLAHARVNLGNVLAAGGHWGDAEKSFRRALADSATDYDAMNNLAIALLRQRRNLPQARALAERAAASGADRDSIYQATLAEIRAATR